MEKKHLNTNSLSYKDQEQETTEEESFRHSLFFGLFEDPETKRLRSGSMKRQYSDMGDNYHRLYEGNRGEEEEEEQRIDMKVLMLLEYFRELYVREIQVLKKIFPGAKDEFVGFFRKIGEAMSRIKKPCDRTESPTTMQRSLSVGSVASRGIVPMANERFKVTTVSAVPMANERFKVTTVSAGSGGGGGSGGGAATGQGQTKK